MPSFTYVYVVNLTNKTTKHFCFKRLKEALDFLKRYPCKGHFCYASRYDEILAVKSDLNLSMGYHFFERVAKGHKFTIGSPDDSECFSDS